MYLCFNKFLSNLLLTSSTQQRMLVEQYKMLFQKIACHWFYPYTGMSLLKICHHFLDAYRNLLIIVLFASPDRYFSVPNDRLCIENCAWLSSVFLLWLTINWKLLFWSQNLFVLCISCQLFPHCSEAAKLTGFNSQRNVSVIHIVFKILQNISLSFSKFFVKSFVYYHNKLIQQ